MVSARLLDNSCVLLVATARKQRRIVYIPSDTVCKFNGATAGKERSVRYVSIVGGKHPLRVQRHNKQSYGINANKPCAPQERAVTRVQFKEAKAGEEIILSDARALWGGGGG